ncbi:MAG: VWA domain-containing protein [Acidobacteriia bacterium]|nr:VWA domain-containing protein [Terriglobia bacterium]
MFSGVFQKSWGMLCAVALLSGMGGKPLYGQQPGQPEAPPLTIRVSTRLILVDVVVTDKKGKPITGLKAEDFTLQEKGKNQKVAFFTPPGEAERQAPPQLGPGIYTNKPEYRSPGGPVTVLLLDAANTAFKDQAYARRQMLQFVKDQYKPGQRMAVFILTSKLGVLQDFTSDPQLLYNALLKYLPNEQQQNQTSTPPALRNSDSVRGNSGGALDLLNQQLQDFSNIEAGFMLDRRVEITLAAMRSLSRILGGIPGRKSVIWVTAAFPFSLIPEDRDITQAEQDNSLPYQAQQSLGTRVAGASAETQRTQHGDEIRETAAQLASAQIAIYPVDARGVVGIGDSDQETMREMARETGGKAYIDQNEIKQGVVLALDDYPASYTLGYYPEDKKWDGKYRPIKVKLDRDGLEVRHRRGYFAIDPSQLKDRKTEREVAEALTDKAPDTQVTFSAQVKPGDKGKLSVDFLVDPSTVSAQDASDGGKKLDVAFYAAIFSADGKMLGNQSMTVNQSFNADTYKQIQQRGILIHMDLDPKPGGSELRMGVQDRRTGSVGTLTAPLSQH